MNWEQARGNFEPLATKLGEIRATLVEQCTDMQALDYFVDQHNQRDVAQKPNLEAHDQVDLGPTTGLMAELRDKCAEYWLSHTFDRLEYLPLFVDSPGVEYLGDCLDVLEPFAYDELPQLCAKLHNSTGTLAAALRGYPMQIWIDREPGDHPHDQEVRRVCAAAVTLADDFGAVLTELSVLVRSQIDEAAEGTSEQPVGIKANTVWTEQQLRDYADEHGFTELRIGVDSSGRYKYDIAASRIAYGYMTEEEGGLAHLEAILEWAATVNLSMKTQYHGTGRAAAAAMVDEGFQDKGSKIGRAFGDGAYTTTLLEVATRYANDKALGLGNDGTGSIVVGKYRGEKILKYFNREDGTAEIYTSRKIVPSSRHPQGLRDDTAIAKYAAEQGFDAIYYKGRYREGHWGDLHYLITRNRANVRVLMKIDPTNPAHPRHAQWLARGKMARAAASESAAKALGQLAQPRAEPARNLHGHHLPASAPDRTGDGLRMRAEYVGEEHRSKWPKLSRHEQGPQAGRIATWYWDNLTRRDLEVHPDANGCLRDGEGNPVSGQFGFVEAIDGRIYLFDQHELRVFPEGSDEPLIRRYASDWEFWGIINGMSGDWYIQCLNHSSPVAGANVRFAGEVEIRDGIIGRVLNRSGHYQPNGSQTYNWLANRVQPGRDGLNVGGGIRGGTRIELLEENPNDPNYASTTTLRADQFLGTGTFGRPADSKGLAIPPGGHEGGSYQTIVDRKAVTRELDNPDRRQAAEIGALVREAEEMPPSARPSRRRTTETEYSGDDYSDVQYSDVEYSDVEYSDDE